VFGEADGYGLRLVHYGRRWNLFDRDSVEYQQLRDLIAGKVGVSPLEVYEITQPGRWWVDQSEIEEATSPLIDEIHHHGYHVRVPYGWDDLRKQVFALPGWKRVLLNTRDIALGFKTNRPKGIKFSSVGVDVYYHAASGVLAFRLDTTTVPGAVRVDPLLYQCGWIFKAEFRTIRARYISAFIHVRILASGREYLSLNREVLPKDVWAIATNHPQALVIGKDGCHVDVPIWYDARFRKVPQSIADLPSSHGFIISGTPLEVSVVDDAKPEKKTPRKSWPGFERADALLEEQLSRDEQMIGWTPAQATAARKACMAYAYAGLVNYPMVSFDSLV
jgi:hypothetical protein